MKKTLINIWAYDHHTKFIIEHVDDLPENVEKVILDKLGEKGIVWESAGMFKDTPKRITYEEVINDTRAIQYKTVLGVRVATGAPEGGQI